MEMVSSEWSFISGTGMTTQPQLRPQLADTKISASDDTQYQVRYTTGAKTKQDRLPVEALGTRKLEVENNANVTGLLCSVVDCHSH